MFNKKKKGLFSRAMGAVLAASMGLGIIGTVGWIATGKDEVYAKDIGGKNSQVCDACKAIKKKKPPTGRDYNNGTYGKEYEYEDVFGNGTVYRGGNSLSGLQGGTPMDNDPNDFANVLPYGDTYIDVTKMEWTEANKDNFIIDIQDDRFVWAAGSDYEGLTDGNKEKPLVIDTDPMGQGLTASQKPMIAYAGPLKGFLDDYLGESKRSGNTNSIEAPAGSYLYRITYLGVVTLKDGTKGNLTITVPKVQIETTVTVDDKHPYKLTYKEGEEVKEYSYTKALIRVQTYNEMSVVPSIKDSKGNNINPTDVLVKTGAQVATATKSNTQWDTTWNVDKYTRAGTGAIIDIDIAVTDMEGNPVSGSISYAANDLDFENYQDLWGRSLEDDEDYKGRHMFNEAMTIKEGSLSYAVTPKYDHADGTNIWNGWVPVAPGEDNLSTPLFITQGNGNYADGVRFSATSVRVIRDKDGTFDNALFSGGVDKNGVPNNYMITSSGRSSNSNAGSNISSGTKEGEVGYTITERDINDNVVPIGVRNQLYGKIKNSGTTVDVNDMTNEQVFDYLGQGSYATWRNDQGDGYDTGFAVLLNAAGSKLQWSGSVHNGGSVNSKLFDTAIYTTVTVSHGTGGGIYFETYDITTDDCKVTRNEGNTTLEKGTDATVTIVPEDGYRVKTITVGNEDFSASAEYTPVYNADGTVKSIIYESVEYDLTNWKVTVNGITFEANADGTIDVTLVRVQDFRHVHADFTADYYFYKVWKGTKDPTSLNLKATPFAFVFKDVEIDGIKYTIDGNKFTDTKGDEYILVNDSLTIGEEPNMKVYYLRGNTIVHYDRTNPDNPVIDETYNIRMDYVQKGDPVTFTVASEDAEDTTETNVLTGEKDGYTTWKIRYPAEGYTTKSEKEWGALPIETDPGTHNKTHVERIYWFVTEEAPGWSLVEYDNSTAEAPGKIIAARDRKEIYYTGNSGELSEWAQASVKDFDQAEQVIESAADNAHAFMSVFSNHDEAITKHDSWGGEMVNVPAVVINVEKTWDDDSNAHDSRHDVWFHLDASVTDGDKSTEIKDVLPPQKLAADATDGENDNNLFKFTWGNKEDYSDDYLSEYAGFEDVTIVGSTSDLPDGYTRDSSNPFKYVLKNGTGTVYYVNVLSDEDGKSHAITYSLRETDKDGNELDVSDNTKFITGYTSVITELAKDAEPAILDDVEVDSYTGKVTNKLAPPIAKDDETWGQRGDTQKGHPSFKEGSSPIDTVRLIDPKTGEPTESNTVPALDEGDNEIGTYTLEYLDGVVTVTFKPDPDYVGTPKPCLLVATDEFGKTAEAKYQPHVYDAKPLVTKDGQYDPEDHTGNTLKSQSVDATGAFDMPGEIKTIKLLDPDTGEEVDAVIVPGEGTYTIDENGVITFTPEEGFTGKGKGVEVHATDVDGHRSVTSYNPIVVPNKQTEVLKRIVEYKYIDNAGNEVTGSKEETYTFTRVGEYDPDKDDHKDDYDEDSRCAETIDYPDWTPQDTDDIGSPADDGGWKPDKEKVNGLKGLTPDNAKDFGFDDKGVKRDKVFYHPEAPLPDAKETWGTPGEVQKYSGKTLFKVTTPKTAKDDAGSREDNEIVDIKLIDPDTGEETEGPVNAYAGGKVIGTYSYDPATDTIKFTPAEGFDGSVDPDPVKVKGTDKNGLSTISKYQPHTVKNVETKTITRKISYKYIDANGKEASKTVTQTVTFTRKATLDPDTHEPVWGDWEYDGSMDAVTSPEIEGWIADRDVVDAFDLSKVDPDDSSTYPEDELVIYHEPPKADEKITYGGKGETQKGIPPFEKGTGELVSFTLIDPETGELVDTVTVKGVGKYTVDPETGEITFEPVDDFVGKAPTVTVRGTDENGLTADGKYTPVVVDNEETKSVTRTIEYVYYDGKPVLDDDGKAVVMTETKTFTRKGKVNPDTGAVTWDPWTPQNYEDVVSKDQVPADVTNRFAPDKEVVAGHKVTPLDGDENTKVVYSRRTFTVIYVDGTNGKSAGGNEAGKDYGSNPAKDNTVTPDDGYVFTGRYSYVIYLADGTTVTGETDDPSSVEVIGDIVFTPIYEKADPEPVDPTDPTDPTDPVDPEPTDTEPAEPSEEPARKSAPKTGDTGNIFMWMAVAGAASTVAVLTAALCRGRKHRGRR